MAQTTSFSREWEDKQCVFMKHFQKYNEELLFKMGKKILTVGENALRTDYALSRHFTAE